MIDKKLVLSAQNETGDCRSLPSHFCAKGPGLIVVFKLGHNNLESDSFHFRFLCLFLSQMLVVSAKHSLCFVGFSS
jgi:hypothetical protein